MDNANSLINTNNSKLFRTCQENLVSLGKCFRSPAAISDIGRSDFIDRLFGELTHFAFVVDLGGNASRERDHS